MLRLFRIFNLRHVRRQPLETVLVLLGIALGVAVMVGIDLANQNALRSFHESVEAVVGRATHEVVGGPGGVPDSSAAHLMRHPGIIAAPILEYLAICRETENQPVRLLAIDPFLDRSIRDLYPGHQENSEINKEATTSSDSVFQSFMKFISLPNHALITEPFARRYALVEGDSLHVLISSEWKNVIIAGIISLREDNRLADQDLLVVDIATGQELLNRAGSIDRVDIIGDHAEIEKLAASLPAPLKLSRPQRRSEYVDSMLQSFRLNLTALSLLAVFVGMFLIYNTVMFSVLQRRKDLGILRCLGVTRAQVVSTLFVEASVVGVIGAWLGLLLGYFLSQYATPAIGATIRDLYVFIVMNESQIDGRIMLKGFLLGLGATWIAALVPALEAAAIAPAVAVRRSSLETRAGRLVPRLAMGGFLFLIVAVVLAFMPGGVLYGFAAALALAGAAVLLTPLFTSAMTRWLSSPLRRRAGPAPLPYFSPNAGRNPLPLGKREAAWRMPGLLAARGIHGALSRTAVAIAALMIALSMVLGMQIMINSFRISIQTWVKSILQADFYMAPLGNTTARWHAVLPEELLRVVSRMPEVDAVNTYRAGEFEYDGRLIYLVSIRAEVLSERTDFIFNTGEDSDNWGALQRGEVFVSESFAQRFSITSGDTVALQTQTGRRRFRVAAVFVDYSLDQGQVIMDHSTFAMNWGPVRINSAGVFLKSDVDRQDFLAKLKAASAEKYAVVINSNLDLRRQVLEIFDKTFAITHVLQVLATIVAFIGIASAISSLLVERTREFGTLRAIGMSWTQLRQMIILESGLMGGLASLLALPTGFALALILVHVINVRSFGWLITIRSRPVEYAQIAVMALGAALLAALYPLWRLKRITVAAALREE